MVLFTACSDALYMDKPRASGDEPPIRRIDAESHINGLYLADEPLAMNQESVANRNVQIETLQPSKDSHYNEHLTSIV